MDLLAVEVVRVEQGKRLGCGQDHRFVASQSLDLLAGQVSQQDVRHYCGARAEHHPLAVARTRLDTTAIGSSHPPSVLRFTDKKEPVVAELVRARLNGGVEKNVSDVLAKKAGLTVLDESTRNPDGTLRGDTRSGGRPRKQKTTVAKAAAKKAAADQKESDQ